MEGVRELLGLVTGFGERLLALIHLGPQPSDVPTSPKTADHVEGVDDEAENDALLLVPEDDPRTPQPLSLFSFFECIILFFFNILNFLIF